MKKLTLDLYERIIDAFYKKSKQFTDLEIGDGTKHNCEQYIAFYALHNNLYWCERDGNICGVSTAHPGRADFSWEWPEEQDGIWTAHAVWADDIHAHADVLQQFLSSQPKPVKELWTIRRNNFVQLSEEKLKRLFSYGKRVNHHTSSCSSELCGDDAGNSDVSN